MIDAQRGASSVGQDPICATKPRRKWTLGGAIVTGVLMFSLTSGLLYLVSEIYSTAKTRLVCQVKEVDSQKLTVDCGEGRRFVFQEKDVNNYFKKLHAHADPKRHRIMCSETKGGRLFDCDAQKQE